MKNIASFLYYFFLFGAVAAYMPYIVLYFTALGLSGTQIGILTGIGPLITIVAGPFWTGVADASLRHRLILSLNSLAVGACVLLYPRMSGFNGLLLLVCLYALASAPIAALADSAVMHMLRGDSGKYGRVRLGGTFGFGGVAPLVGILIERYGQQWIFWSFAFLIALSVLLAQLLSFPTHREARPAFLVGLGRLLADNQWRTILAMLFIGGVGLASINTYLFLHMQNLGASQSLMGFALTLSICSEIPAMYFVSRLTERFPARNLILLGLGATALRLLINGLAPLPVWILVGQVLHGLTFPILWVAGVSFAHKYAPQGLSATAQGVMGTVFMGLGTAVGAFMGGLVIEAFSTRGLYLTYSAALFLALIFFVLLTKKVLKVAGPETRSSG